MTDTKLSISDRGYSNPDVLVSTEWVSENQDNVILVESNEDPLLYPSGHIPGAFEVDWTRDLNDPLTRDYLNQEGFTNLMRRIGADESTTIVFYGDRNNWWAAYAMWVFSLFGFTNTKLMDGGRQKWKNEDKPLVKDRPAASTSSYQAPERNDEKIRAFRDEVLAHVKKSGKMIDVRSPEEFNGTKLHMPDYPNEGALRGGHIPGAKSVPWAKVVNADDGTFKDATALRSLYEAEAGLSKNDDVIVYCRIGERSSHTWFVLTHLLGYPSVKNYDGSWTEWGNLVGVPIEK